MIYIKINTKIKLIINNKRGLKMSYNLIYIKIIKIIIL